MADSIVAVIDDLLFQSRVADQARALGYDVAIADTTVAFDAAIGDGVALVVVDLHVSGIDWRRAVGDAREQGVPVLAFGRHTEAALLREAREAGCDRVVARSTLVEELAQLIRELASSGTAD
ncbi:MAG: hypothetical protein WBD55_04110 [Dehalococcoidia bacterium]